jgi:hypothetical protein
MDPDLWGFINPEGLFENLPVKRLIFQILQSLQFWISGWGKT